MKTLQWLSLFQLVYTQTITASNNQPELIPSCPYDPFQHLISPKASFTCPLSSPPPSEVTTEFISFEDWKARQLTDVIQKNASIQPQTSTKDGDNKAIQDRLSSPNTDEALVDLNTDSQDSKSQSSPRVPLTDRFNYASQDCTARIHSVHKGAKSPASVLTSKKDRYMLSPCGTKNKYIIVELCDDVRIDTVQLANFEFFSGVFKDIRISLGETSPGDPQGWIDAGTYRAKNIRGVQTFHPPQGRMKFYRYVKIEFLTHYGAEFYCPVSVLRVYGLTHMEDYKWVGWQSEAAKAIGDKVVVDKEAADRIALLAGNNETISLEGAEDISGSTEETASQVQESASGMIRASDTKNDPVITTSPPAPHDLPESQQVASPTVDVNSSAAGSTCDTPAVSSVVSRIVPTSLPPLNSQSSTSVNTRISTSTVSPATIVSTSTTTRAASATVIIVDTTSINGETTQSRTPSHAIIPISQATAASGGESIYRTIMNKLTMLEINSTLSVLYVEEQTRSIRNVVRKLEEDVGRLDAAGKRQQQLLQRVVQDLERQRRDMEKEKNSLTSQVNALVEEVTMEKRLGIVQLCLLLMVLGFMAVTRGSSGVQNLRQERSRVRNWRSSDWSRWGRSTTSKSPIGEVVKRATAITPSRPLRAPSPPSPPSIPNDGHYQTSGNTHTQSAYRTPRHGRTRVSSFPPLPPRSVPRIGSHNTPQSSVRKLAAHLHEVKTEKLRRRPPVDLGVEEPSDGEGTPRLQISLSEWQANGRTRGNPLKGKDRMHGERVHTPEVRGVVIADAERGASPSTTAADDLSEDSAAWEDTTTEGEDEEETFFL